MRQILALVLCCLFTVTARAACRVEARSVVPVDVVEGNILVTVQVNDVPATFILDTGVSRTRMGEDVVHRLGLERDSWVASAVRQPPNALPRSLRLGDVVLRRKTITGDTSVTVGPLPVNAVGDRPIAGLLGRDFLSPFDLDIDPPDHRVTLYDVRGCEAWFLPWRTPYAAIPASTLMRAALVVPVQVDGHPLRALVDTGVSTSLITAAGMFRLGLTAEALARDPGDVGSAVRHRFAELRVGPDVTQAPILSVAAAHVVPIVDMLLGADWLRYRRVWLSFATKQIFVAEHQNG